MSGPPQTGRSPSLNSRRTEGFITSSSGPKYGTEFSDVRRVAYTVSTPDQYRIPVGHRGVHFSLSWGRDQEILRIVVGNRLWARAVNYCGRNWIGSDSRRISWRLPTRFLVALHPLLVVLRKTGLRPMTNGLHVGTTYLIKWSPYDQGSYFYVEQVRHRRFVLT